MESALELDFDAAVATYEWLRELGADEAICDAPLSRYDLPEKLEAPVVARAVAPAPAPVRVVAAQAVDPVAVAREAAEGAVSVEALRESLTEFEHCALKKGARNMVFAGGQIGARVLVVTEAPNREEELAGQPLMGRDGALFDRMFAAIGLSRQHPDPAQALYILPVLPWRPLASVDPADMAMMLPFLTRHIELAQPDLVVLMGNSACAAGLGQNGALRLRGQWGQAFGKPCLPMVHPSYLAAHGSAKRDAWADLLALKAAL